jgi:hypothetical protein
MRESTFLDKLGEKEANDEDLAEEALRHRELLRDLLNGISSQNPRTKFRSAKILRIISKRNPEVLYSNMEFFADLLDNENNILKWNAIDIIANLTTVDSHDKFDGLFERFYSNLHKGSLITAGHIVDNSGTIALAKPELQDMITKELLKVEEIPLPTEECRNILIGKAIKAFEVYYEKIKDKDELVSFVERQLDNSRKATKAKAESLLRKLEEHRAK